jgi:hypothetical protein
MDFGGFGHFDDFGWILEIFKILRFGHFDHFSRSRYFLSISIILPFG